MIFDQEARIFKNVIICSYSTYRKLKKQFPNKEILPDAHCPNSWFYYINQTGQVRHYDALTGILYDHCIGELTSVMIKTRYAVSA